ncbi:hypothetical protein [Orrella daihaiensis]|uniref:Uncharacterized protein n=1 Tax=Orrella daihaiensis TaxID=2782176 RepID=A0ABY4AJL5_9BURK|nr:hypothetical protein [Orrella daihaiensis]UOD50379.1 hypothetical protein DHf2319_00020 [Orrella daihaiensis]
MRKTQTPLQLWLAQQGLNEELFAALPLLHVQAWQAAHELVAHHRNLLNPEQVQLLRTYIEVIHNRRLRQGITNTQCYAVLNLSKKIYRQLFKKHRRHIARNQTHTGTATHATTV